MSLPGLIGLVNNIAEYKETTVVEVDYGSGTERMELSLGDDITVGRYRLTHDEDRFSPQIEVEKLLPVHYNGFFGGDWWYDMEITPDQPRPMVMNQQLHVFDQQRPETPTELYTADGMVGVTLPFVECLVQAETKTGMYHFSDPGDVVRDMYARPNDVDADDMYNRVIDHPL